MLISSLVKLSTMCFFIERVTQIVPLSTFSLIKCVHFCMFCHIMLNKIKKNVDGCFIIIVTSGYTEIWSSINNFLNHRASQIYRPTTLNSVSILFLATTFCFLFFQVTKFPNTKVPYLVMDFLSSVKSA